MSTLPPDAIQRLRARLDGVALRAAGDILDIKSEAEARGRLRIIVRDMDRALAAWKLDESARLWSAAHKRPTTPNDPEAA